MTTSQKFRVEATKILPFWLFTFLFKISANLQYTLLSTLGERVFPIWIVGLLIGGGAFVQVMLDVPAGFILDRYGYVRLLKIATWLFITAAVALVLGLTPWTYVATVMLATGGWLFFGPGVDAYVLSRAKKEFAGRFIALKDIMESAGVVVGMATLPFMIVWAPHWIGIALGVPLLLAFATLLLVPRDRHAVLVEKKIVAQGYYIRRNFVHHLVSAFKKLNPASGLLCLSGFSASTFYGIIWFVVPIMIARAAQSGVLGFGLAVFDGAILLVGFGAGSLTDRWDKRWLVFWGLLLFSVCAALLGFHLGIWFLVIGFLATSGDELSSVSLWAWMDHLDKNHADDALIAGTVSFSQDIGWTLGPIIAGLLFEIIGPSWTIAAGAIFIFCTWLVACVFLRRTAMPVGLYRTEAYFPRKRRHKR